MPYGRPRPDACSRLRIGIFAWFRPPKGVCQDLGLTAAIAPAADRLADPRALDLPSAIGATRPDAFRWIAVVQGAPYLIQPGIAKL
jgi:hypothetical protein